MNDAEESSKETLEGVVAGFIKSAFAVDREVEVIYGCEIPENQAVVRCNSSDRGVFYVAMWRER